MKKNLLNKEASEWMVQRVQQLQVDTPPRWGSMTATEMLLHINKSHQHLLSPYTPSGQQTSLKQLLVRWLVLYLMPRYPKGAKAPKQLRTKGAVSDADFEDQKQLFIELVHRFARHTEPIQHYHPYFGALNTRQWGLTCFKHADHHLRQFGM